MVSQAERYSWPIISRVTRAAWSITWGLHPYPFDTLHPSSRDTPTLHWREWMQLCLRTLGKLLQAVQQWQATPEPAVFHVSSSEEQQQQHQKCFRDTRSQALSQNN